MDNIEKVVEDLTSAFAEGITKYLPSHKMTNRQIKIWDSMCHEARMRIRDPEGEFRKSIVRVRYAIIETHNDISNYLPKHYEFVRVIKIDDKVYQLIKGQDYMGWTLEGYVIPRFASGMHNCKEIDIHDLVKMVLQ